jgi:hypothetical protein
MLNRLRNIRRKEQPVEKKQVEEKLNIKHKDGIPFLSYFQLNIKFPFNKTNFTRNPNFEEVYIVNKQYMVKQVYHFEKFIRELNAYASIIHPCIIRPIYWSVDGNHGYFVFERGENIAEVFQRQKSLDFLKEIMFDTLSALEFLHSKGITHGDIRAENIIYHQGKTKLINLALSTKAELNEDNIYYLTKLYDEENPESHFRFLYRDIEYSERQYNNINFEIYSLFTSFIVILDNREYPEYGELSTYELDDQYNSLKWFFDSAKLFQENRPPAAEFLEEFIRQNPTFKIYEGSYFTKSQGIPGKKDSIINVMKRLIKIAYDEDIKAETLFLCLDLIQRTYSLVEARYSNFIKTELIFGCAALRLAMLVNGEIYPSSESWNVIVRENKNFDVILQGQTVDILRVTGGIITTLTYWDFAQSRDDLLPLLRDTVNWNYNPQLIRDLTVVSNINNNKCITVRDFISESDIKTMRFLTTYERSPVKSPKRKVGSCSLDLSLDIQIVERYWDVIGSYWSGIKNIRFDEDDDDGILANLIGSLMHNRDILDELNLDISWNIFNFLIDMQSNRKRNKLAVFLLDTLCHFDWLTNLEMVGELNKNPFVITDEDFI